ncbi:MAG: SDR family oxidoreductase [Burkholderiales bacterium]|nr:SDR family oxidoreductase [Burkholderiales bacterium]
MKKILVTGGAGFLGTNLCQRLINDGNQVYCVDNLYTGRKQNIVHLQQSSNFKFILHDIREPLELVVDEIYNLACPASPPHYQKDPIYTLNTCYLGVLNMLNLARQNNAKIMQASTSEIYGDPLVHPQPENYRGNVNPLGIRACYDEGKRIGETLCFDYYRKYQTKIKVVRIFNTYGKFMDPKDGRVVSNFIIQALNGGDITVYGNGQQTRSFCYVDDLIEGFIKTMASNESFTGPVNLGNPDEFTVLELANMVIKLTRSNSKIINLPLPEDDPLQRKPVINLALEQLNWKPKVALNEGLIKAIEYFSTLDSSSFDSAADI